jgi:hypothetical protein
VGVGVVRRRSAQPGRSSVVEGHRDISKTITRARAMWPERGSLQPAAAGWQRRKRQRRLQNAVPPRSSRARGGGTTRSQLPVSRKRRGPEVIPAETFASYGVRLPACLRTGTGASQAFRGSGNFSNLATVSRICACFRSLNPTIFRYTFQSFPTMNVVGTPA